MKENKNNETIEEQISSLKEEIDRLNKTVKENDEIIINLISKLSKNRQPIKKSVNNKQIISSVDVIHLLWRNVIYLFFALIVGSVCVFMYTKYKITPQYSSNVSMYVQSYTNITQENADNDISTSKQLINTYIQVLKDDEVMRDVGEKILAGTDYKILENNFDFSKGLITPQSLLRHISLTTVQDTSAIFISATTSDAKLSALICNTICDVAGYYTNKAIGVGEIKSINRAKIYPTPVSPNILKNTVMGGILGVLILATLILIYDYFDTSIKDSDKLSKKFKKPILGEIEEVNVSKKNRAEHISLLDKKIPFNVVESYKALRTNITYAVSTSDRKAFIVSSANPSESKSTVASSIAIAIAQEGQNVLLIDADMRKPVQHKIFGVKNETGLSYALSKLNTFNECIQETGINKLKVMTSGPIPPNPSELLSSKQVEFLLNEMSEQFDIIVIDSPPVNVVSDALNISSYVAGILAVVRSGYTDSGDISELIDRANKAHMNVLGFVLTRIKTKKSGNYYKGYRKYKYDYDYTQKSE